MKRRSFILKSSFSGIALTVIPSTALLQETEEYSVLELMGKEDIDLYGKGINLRKDAMTPLLL